VRHAARAGDYGAAVTTRPAGHSMGIARDWLSRGHSGQPTRAALVWLRLCSQMIAARYGCFQSPW